MLCGPTGQSVSGTHPHAYRPRLFARPNAAALRAAPRRGVAAGCRTGAVRARRKVDRAWAPPDRASTRRARLLARLLRLPRASAAAETRLVVTSKAGGEQWRRTFDGRRIDTRQFGCDGCVLAERIGVLEFRFRLEPADGSLVFRQVAAAVVLGRFRVGLPEAWAPRIEAREDPAGAGRMGVHVRVTLPAVGPVLTYDGTVGIENLSA